MSAQLDAQFGRCEAPVRFNDDEEQWRPRTMFVLDRSTAHRIGNLIEISRRDSSQFPSLVFSDFTILYLVADRGDILIAIEEGVPRTQAFSRSESPALFPLPNAIKSAYIKLGHPALVGCQPARIGGEIICDLDETPPQWYISNRSGRYGLNLGRTPQQLANVAEEFAKYGIRLNLDFI
jgi:hypothetical protein